MPGKTNTCSYLSGYKHNTITKANSSEDRSIYSILVILSRPLYGKIYIRDYTEASHSRHPEPTPCPGYEGEFPR